MVAAPDRVGGPPPASRRAVPEQLRARYPESTGFVERDGVRVFYEVYGSGEPTLLLLPTWSIIHSRFWKLQIPDFARRHRVVTFDPRGNGRSDRPSVAAAYAESEFAADTLAVMDATGTERAVLAGLSLGAQHALMVASDHPERVAGAVFIAPSLPMARVVPGREPVSDFEQVLETDAGWAKYNASYWRRDYRGFLEFFFAQCLSEAYSTKATEDAVGWGLETDPRTLILTHRAPHLRGREDVLDRCSRMRCPVLVIHGSDDRIRPHADGAELAELTAGRLVTLAAAGHLPNVRDPVRVNLAIRDFLRGLTKAT